MVKLVLVILAGIVLTVVLIRYLFAADSGDWRRRDRGPMVFGPDADGDGDGDGGD